MKIVLLKLELLKLAVKIRLAFSNAHEKDMPKKLGIRDLKGAFLTLFCGYTLAFAVLLIEIFFKRLRQSKCLK